MSDNNSNEIVTPKASDQGPASQDNMVVATNDDLNYKSLTRPQLYSIVTAYGKRLRMIAESDEKIRKILIVDAASKDIVRGVESLLNSRKEQFTDAAKKAIEEAKGSELKECEKCNEFERQLYVKNEECEIHTKEKLDLDKVTYELSKKE